MEAFKKKIERILEQEPLKNQGLTLIGVGSDKVVFETAGSTRKIFKVSQDVLRRKVANLLVAGNNITTFVDGDNELQKNKIEEEKRDEEVIRDIFGPGHFLRKGNFRIKIPITKELLMSFVNENTKIIVEQLPDDYEGEVEMLAETQLVAEELKDPEKFSPVSFNTDLITADNFRNTKDIESGMSKARELIDRGFLSEFAELSENEGYRSMVKEIVSKLIEYTKKTGMLVDIFGPNNITLYKKEDGSIDYHILELLMPGSQEKWAKNISQDAGLNLLRHHYVYLYSIKSLADRLGIENNLEPEDLIYFKGHGLSTGAWPKSKE